LASQVSPEYCKYTELVQIKTKYLHIVRLHADHNTIAFLLIVELVHITINEFLPATN